MAKKTAPLKTKDEKSKDKEAKTEVRAIARFVKAPPRKVRLVMDNIRGKSTKEALNILRFTPKRAAKTLEKVLLSAIANAENTQEMDADKLFVYRAFADAGPIYKKWMPRAMGRASKIYKRTSHITIVVKERGAGI